MLVERDAEMVRLGTGLERATAGDGSLLVVEGPAGIGKSRLLAMQVLRARGGVLERDLAYRAVRQLMERPLAALSEAECVDVLGGAAAPAKPALALVGSEAAAPPDRSHAIEHGAKVVLDGGTPSATINSGGVTVEDAGTGFHDVKFPSPAANNCAFAVTLDTDSVNGLGRIAAGGGGNTVRVVTTTTAGTAADLSFDVVAFC